MREFAIGMNSDVDSKKDLHILILDFDEVTVDEVNESIKELQNFWSLSDAFIYRTKNGFHAYFYYDIIPYTRVRMIINFARFVDPMYKFISRFYDYKTIRVVGKYKERDIFFEKIIKGERDPSLREVELGNLKRKEREYLSSMGNIINKKNLKD